MTLSLAALLFFVLGLIHPANMSFSAPLEDLEGSGYDLETSGSGSGDWSEEGEMKNIKDHTNREGVTVFAAKAGGGTKNTFQGTSVMAFDSAIWHEKDSGSEFVAMANSKSFFERKEVFAGVIAGGVTGVVVALALGSLLIYHWQKKDDGGYILGQQRASEEDYYKPNREEVVV